VLLAQIAALVLAAGAFAVSGCGGSSTTNTAQTVATATQATATTSSHTVTAPPPPTVKLATGTPLTRAQLRAKAEVVCKRLNAQLAVTSVKTLKELGRALPQAAADEHAEFAQLIKLVPPSSMTNEWQQFLGGTKEWAENSAKLAVSARTRQLSLSAPLLLETRAIHEHVAHLAKQAGFKECALV
jgi:hypothetical protein